MYATFKCFRREALCFWWGEEIASANPLPFKGFRAFRDDFPAARAGSGWLMFKFY